MDMQLSEFYERNYQLCKHYMIFIMDPERFEQMTKKKENPDPMALKRKATWNRFKRRATRLIEEGQTEFESNEIASQSSIVEQSPSVREKKALELPGVPKKHVYEKRIDKAIMKMYFMKEFGHVMKYLMGKYCITELCPR